MRVVITGVNGFIGQYLARELIKKRHIVIGVGKEKKSSVAGINKYYSGTVLDETFIERIIRNCEVVVHLAALTAHEDIISNKFETLQINFLGTKNVLDAFLKSKTTKKFLYSSTGKVYGKIIELPINEMHPTTPQNILGKSKLITEKLIEFYADKKKEFIIFRIFNIYGPKQKNNFLIPTIFSQLKENKQTITLGDTSAKRDYIYIDDLINAFILAIEKKSSTGLSIYNICTGVSTSASQIVKIISKIKEKNIKIKTNSALFRSDETDNEYGSYYKVKKSLGWKPNIGLEEGLKLLCKL